LFSRAGITAKKEVVEDLKSYSLVIARESITYEVLIYAGVTKNTKLYPDPAFALEKVELDIPPNFIQGKTIGINVSPLVQRLEQKENTAYENYKILIIL